MERLTLVVMMLMVLTGCAGSAPSPMMDNSHGVRAHQLFLGGDLPRAIEIYKDAFATARRIDNTAGAAQALSNIGRAYYEMRLLDSAALYFVMAYDKFDFLGRKTEASRTAAWIALCFASAGDEVPARQWLDTAATHVNISRTASDRHFLSVMNATVDFRLTSNISDEAALNAAHRFYRKKKNHSALATIYILRADAELQKGNCAAADQLLENALASLDRSRENYRRSGTLLRMARAKFCAGDDRAGRHFYERGRDSAPRGVPVPTMEEMLSP